MGSGNTDENVNLFLRFYRPNNQENNLMINQQWKNP